MATLKKAKQKIADQAEFEAKFAEWESMKNKLPPSLVESLIRSYFSWILSKYKLYIKQHSNEEFDTLIEQTSLLYIKRVMNSILYEPSCIRTRVKKDNFILAVFSLINYRTEVSFNYAIQHIPAYHSKGNVDYLNLGSVSLGPSFVSEDGEYKSRFILNPMVDNWMAGLGLYADYQKFLEDMTSFYQDYIQDVLNCGLQVDLYFPPDISTASRGILKDKLQNKRRKDIELFSIAWICDMYLIVNKRFPNNVNSKCRDFYNDEMKKFQEQFKTINSKYPVIVAAFAYLYGEHIPNETAAMLYEKKIARLTPLGTKIIPLSIIEIQHPLDLQYKPWKELLILNKLRVMHPLFICKGFPMLYSWLFISDSNKKLYDNPKQYERVSVSDEAINVITTLKKAEKQTSELIFRDSNRIAKDKVASWLKDRLHELKDKISDPIAYLKEKIIMSTNGLNMVFEHVGYTFSNALDIEDPIYHKEIGNIFSSNDKFAQTMFHRYMFDMCYNAACLNKLGAIHGDLHLNNFTFKRTYPNPAINSSSKLHETYIIGDYKFYLPTVGYNVCWIDFSRAYIQHSMLSSFQIPKYPFPVVGKKAMYKEESMMALLKLYLHVFPDQMEQKNKLLDLVQTKHDSFLRLIAPIDIYNVCQKLLTVIKLDERSTVKHLAKHRDFLKDLQNNCRTYLIENVNKFLSSPDKYELELDKMEPPMISIIRKCFSEFLSKPADAVEADTLMFDVKIGKTHTLPEFMTEFRTLQDGVEADIPVGNRLNLSLSEPMIEFLKESEKTAYESIKKTSARYTKFGV